MSLLDKVKETAQKGAEKAKEGVKAGQEKIETVKLVTNREASTIASSSRFAFAVAYLA